MGQIFGSFYCMFEDMFGLDLANYLWGQVSPYSTTNLFIPIGLVMLGISLMVMLVYYYILDHPKLCSLWGWLLFLAINFVLNLIIGWQWTQMHLYANKMVYFNKDQQEVQLAIDEWNCFLFGTANGLLSILVFLFFTYCLKWKSTNCWVAPENTFRR